MPDALSLPVSCKICCQLSNREFACQKYGWEENDTHLPAVSGELLTVRDLKPNASRSLILMQCPLCGTYYLYESDYEYLVNGSEDSQTLTRLSTEEAQQYFTS